MKLLTPENENYAATVVTINRMETALSNAPNTMESCARSGGGNSSMK